MQHILQRIRQTVDTVAGFTQGCMCSVSDSRLLATAIGNLLFGAGIQPEEFEKVSGHRRRRRKTSYIVEGEGGMWQFNGCFERIDFLNDLMDFLETKAKK